MGIIRQVQMGGELLYVFIPEDDSVVIGGVRYMLSVINLGAIGEDPNALPYPPSYWPQYAVLAVRQPPQPVPRRAVHGRDRRTHVSSDARRRYRVDRARGAARREPMQMYLDTNSHEMIVWPIYAFPYATSHADRRPGSVQDSHRHDPRAARHSVPHRSRRSPTAQLGEQILVPSDMRQNNPYTFGVTGKHQPRRWQPDRPGCGHRADELTASSSRTSARDGRVAHATRR